MRNLQEQVTKAFCLQNCSDLLWENKCSSDWEKLLKFEAEGWEFAKFLGSLEQSIGTVKVRTIFCNTMLFELAPGGFSDLNK